MRRMLAGCATALMFLHAPTGLCQPASAGVVVTGRVADEAGSPIAAASLELADRTGRRIAATRSGDNGQFTIAASRAPEWVLHVRRLGFAADSSVVRPSAEDDTLVANFVLRSTVQTLTPVEARADPPRSTHQAASYRRPPGGRQASVESSSGLYGSLSGDLQAALLAVPGIAPGAGVMSAFGLPGESNGAGLNGTDSWQTRLPRDGVRRTIRLSTYDPRVGRFSGFHVNAEIASGTPIHTATVRGSVDDVSSAAEAERIVSGTHAGPLGSSERFYNFGYQLSHRSATLPTLAGAGDDVLASLRLSRRTVDSVAAVAARAGIPVRSVADSRDDRREASGVLRIDLTPNDGAMVNTSGSVLYALLTGSAISRRSSAVSLPGFAVGDRAVRQSEGQAMLHYAPYIGRSLTQLRIVRGVAREDEQEAGPGLAAVVLARDPESGVGPLTAVSLGAPPQPGGTIHRDSWFGSVESEWPTWDGAHRLNVHANSWWEGIHTDRSAGPGGTYVFHGTEALAQGRASEFSQWVGRRRGDGTIRRATLALSDVYVREPRARLAVAAQELEGLVVQAGARLDIEVPRFSAERDSLVESTLGVRTDLLPRISVFQPMVGFTWREGLTRLYHGPAVITEARNTLSGGVRFYQSSLAAANLERVLRTGDLYEVRCTGDSAPSPPWVLPTDDAGNAATCATSGVAPWGASRQVMFAEGFRPPSSIRAEISWRRAISQQLAATVSYAWAGNSGLTNPVDVNFSGHATATLHDEAGRPLFVDPALIEPVTGSVPLAGSRRVTELGQVTALRSDGRSRAGEFTVGAEWRFGAPRLLPQSQRSSARTALIRLAYSKARHRVNASGFASTTSGDPRATEWFAAGSPAHVLRAWYTLNWERVASVSMFGMLSSGLRYTPIVGGDINGDGLANDRAFVVDAPRDTARLPSGWHEMLRSLDASARRCLDRQQGRIARANSCTAPAAVTLPAIGIALDHRLLRMRQGSTVSVYLYEPLHFVSAVAGHPRWARWWERSTPNPVLVYPTGFDPDRRSFRYAANRSFGVPQHGSGTRGGRIAIDVRLDVGTHPETHIVRSIVREARKGQPPLEEQLREQIHAAGAMMGEGDIPLVLARADSLKLHPDQRKRLDSLHRAYVERRDSVYAALVGILAQEQADLTSRRIRLTWHAMVSDVVTARYAAAWGARDVLNPDQREWLRARGLAESFDATEASVQRILDGPLLPW